MTSSLTRPQPRQRPPTSARVRPANPTEFQRQFRANAEAALAEKFKGITADGTIEPGLFALEETGVSTRPIQAAAEAFLASLDGEQQRTARFSLDDDAWRRWCNLHTFVMRHGVLLETLSATQVERAFGLLRASLSERGFESARNVMKLNETIGEITGLPEEFGEWLYWLSIFGTPSADEPWGWQIDGHHLNVNCLLVKDQLAKVGVNVNLVKMEGGQQWDALIAGEYDIGVMWWVNDIFDPDQKAQFCVSGDPENRSYYTNYKNPRVTELVNAAAVELDPVKRKEMYYEIQRMTKDDVHWIDLYYSPFRNASRSNVKGFVQNPLGRYMLETAYIE